MKKLFMFLILGLFLISFAAASVDYVEENQTYTIDTIWPSWLGGDGSSIVKLVNNTDQCLTDCSFTLEFQNEQEVSLLEDLVFIDRKGEDVQNTLKNVEFKIGSYENQTKIIPIYDTICEDVYNSTTNNVTQSCTTINTNNETETEEVLVWKNYNGEAVSGLNYLQVNAKKSPIKSMDWIVTFRGEDLIKWAWWNSTWNYKREITLTSNIGNFSYMNISYYANMNNDFSDIRFLDSTESIELNYTIETKSDGNWAIVRLNNKEDNFYMYYGNPSATTTSNAKETHFNTYAGYYMDNNVNDFGNNYNATVSGATLTSSGYINNSYDFDGINDYIIDLGLTGYNDFSVSLRFNADDVSSSILYQEREIGDSNPIVSLELSSGNVLAAFRSNTGSGLIQTSNPTIISTNTWYYVVLTFEASSGNFNISVNAGTPTSATYTGGSFSNIDRSVLGVSGSTLNTGLFNGRIDEVYIYDYILSSQQIQSINNYKEPTFTVGDQEQNAGSIDVDFVTPPTPENYANITEPTITVQVNATYTNSRLTNISYDFYNVNGTVTTYFFENETYQINATLPTAHFHYNVTICGFETVDSSYVCSSTETRHLNHDITPPEINLTAPSGTFDYLIENYTLDLNWTVTDEGEGVDSCWFVYNNITTYLNCSLNTTQFNYSTDKNNLTFYSNDTFGNIQSNSTSWNYKLLEVNQTYNAEVTEGSIETFLAHTKLGSGYSISDAVLFNYNGTQTTGQAFTLAPYRVLRKANFLVPSVEADTNYTFYWRVTLSDSTAINLSSQNQTIYNLAVDNCSSYTNELYNFSVVDEETQALLPTATIETALNFYDADRTEIVFNYSMQFDGVNPLRICLNRNISDSSEYSLDVIARYEDSGSANEYYNIVDTSVTNETESQKITLYDLNLTDSTEFQLTFTGSDFLPVEGALVYVDRQYISENTFKTVELPKTDYNGQTVLHLVRNDVIYNIRIIKDGVVLGNFETLTAFCDDYTIGDCNIELNAFDSVEAVFNYYESLGLIFTEPTYNETLSTVTFNFVTEDGEAKTVRLEVSRNDIFGNRSICNSTLTSSGGTLTCNIDPNLDESTLKTEIYVDNILAISGNVQLDSSGYGVAGYLIMFVMAISFILMFSGSKTGVLISILLTFIASISFGIVAGDIVGIGASGLWLLVIVIVGIIKLNKERAQ